LTDSYSLLKTCTGNEYSATGAGFFLKLKAI